MNKVIFILFPPLLLLLKKEMDKLVRLMAENLNGMTGTNNTY